MEKMDGIINITKKQMKGKQTWRKRKENERKKEGMNEDTENIELQRNEKNNDDEM